MPGFSVSSGADKGASKSRGSFFIRLGRVQMRKIQFLDTTLRDGEQTIGVNFSVENKIAIAQKLEAWVIDVIEAGFPTASPEDFTAVQAVSRNVKKLLFQV